MVSDYTIQEHIRKLEVSTSHKEHMYNILAIYMNLFPVRNAYLFRYSPFGFLGEGIILITNDGLSHIREIRDDIRSLPIIFSAICERKAKFCSGIEYLKQTSSKYIFPSSVNSLIAVPICFGSVVVGYGRFHEYK
ncbi:MULTISPECIES: hypothetical protein [unclassified Bacillus (in: firmicutes)]|uniref:hypothetical protein n=1 Tax=unclassified Bacillus (in: firmicutes) TaxID=185979 RepID=UPI00268D1EE8